jgi:zinc protease
VDVAALVKDYKGDTATAAGETFDPSPANLDARTQRFTLPIGMKVALLPKKTRGETVNFNLSLRFGDEQSVAGKATEGALAGGMLLRGTTKKSRQEIDDAFDKFRAKVSVSGTQTGATANGQTVRAQLADTLRLTAEVLQDPAFPAAELETLKRQRNTRFETSKSEPQDIAQRALGRHDNPYPAGHPRYIPTIDESIAWNNAATVDGVRNFYKKFYGASNAELAIVGDFDPDAMKALVTELFGSWKSPSAYVRVPDPYRTIKPAALRLPVPDKANAILFGNEKWPVNDTSPDYPALLVANFILGESPSSRIYERIRQKDGLSYGAGTFFQPNSFEANSSFGMYAIFAPQNLDKVRAGFAEEFERLLKDGFTDTEVKDAKAAVIQERRLGRSEDGSVASALTAQSYLGRTYAASAAVDAAIEKLTTADVNAAIRKYLKSADFTYAFAGDFK